MNRMLAPAMLIFPLLGLAGQQPQDGFLPLFPSDIDFQELSRAGGPLQIRQARIKVLD